MIHAPEPCQAVVKRHATHVAGGVASEADRELADELRTLGNAALKAGDHLGAYESYSRGILAVAGSAWEGLVALHNNRSASAMELGWHACARDDACDALAVDAKAVKAWFRLARALVALGDPAAVVVCEHAARLAPQDKVIRELRQKAVNRSVSSYKAAPTSRHRSPRRSRFAASQCARSSAASHTQPPVVCVSVATSNLTHSATPTSSKSSSESLSAASRSTAFVATATATGAAAL